MTSAELMARPCGCVRCGGCGGSGRMTVPALGYPEDDLESCDECRGIGLSEVCDRCNDLEELEHDEQP